VRLNFINKGFNREQFLDANELLQEYDIGTKAYVFFKPPFLSELESIKDALLTIKNLVGLKVSTISINPASIHAHTYLEELWMRKKYRPPWLWSLQLLLYWFFQDFGKVNNKPLVLCDSVAGGTDRGAHNCRDRSCNKNALEQIRHLITGQFSCRNMSVTGDFLFKEHCPCFSEWLDVVEL
ncbi:MAG: hypothetical protein ACTSXP_05625, partial [Promethearchaeota archaeon]